VSPPSARAAPAPAPAPAPRQHPSLIAPGEGGPERHVPPGDTRPAR
jgi:hypothetical protein